MPTALIFSGFKVRPGLMFSGVMNKVFLPLTFNPDISSEINQFKNTIDGTLLYLKGPRKNNEMSQSI